MAFSPSLPERRPERRKVQNEGADMAAEMPNSFDLHTVVLWTT
jgi:hypothetical protein